jgi:hypothetical protein
MGAVVLLKLISPPTDSICCVNPEHVINNSLADVLDDEYKKQRTKRDILTALDEKVFYSAFFFFFNETLYLFILLMKFMWKIYFRLSSRIM